jgi:hypothetical protein
MIAVRILNQRARARSCRKGFGQTFRLAASREHTSQHPKTRNFVQPSDQALPIIQYLTIIFVMDW